VSRSVNERSEKSDWCKEGSLTKLTYFPRNSQWSIFLQPEDLRRSAVHLLATSAFLFTLALTAAISAVISAARRAVYVRTMTGPEMELFES